MTDYPYSAPCSYFLIYVYEIPGSVDHAGLLKVGDTSLKSPKNPSELTVNCADLKAAARKRIDQQTGTAGENGTEPTLRCLRGGLTNG